MSFPLIPIDDAKTIARRLGIGSRARRRVGMHVCLEVGEQRGVERWHALWLGDVGLGFGTGDALQALGDLGIYLLDAVEIGNLAERITL